MATIYTTKEEAFKALQDETQYSKENDLKYEYYVCEIEYTKTMNVNGDIIYEQEIVKALNYEK